MTLIYWASWRISLLRMRYRDWREEQREQRWRVDQGYRPTNRRESK